MAVDDSSPLATSPQRIFERFRKEFHLPAYILQNPRMFQQLIVEVDDVLPKKDPINHPITLSKVQQPDWRNSTHPGSIKDWNNTKARDKG